MVLTVLPPVCAHRDCWHPLSFFATKSGEEAQTGPAEYLVTLAIILSFEAQCSLPGLTTAASASQANQSLPNQSLVHSTKLPLG